MPFDDLKYQFNDQWIAICGANSSERRVLIIQLAEVLANWEQSQDDSLDKIQTLKKIGHWKAIAEKSSFQIDIITSTLDEKKVTLQEQLQTLKIELKKKQLRLNADENDVKQFEERIEQLEKEVGVVDSSENALSQKKDSLKKQFETLQSLSSLQTDIKQAKVALNTMEEILLKGNDPSGVLESLTRLFSMREQLFSYYKSYVDTNQHTQENILPLVNNNERFTEIKHVLDRLLNLGKELKDIDQVLAEQLLAQDRLDTEIKTHL